MFTLEELEKLKYRELYKLSVIHKVNKKLAKKQDIIKNLLSLNETKANDVDLYKVNSDGTNKVQENGEQKGNEEGESWVDGTEVFKPGNMAQAESINPTEINRSTFSIINKTDQSQFSNCINKSEIEEESDRRLTYSVVPNDVLLPTNIKKGRVNGVTIPLSPKMLRSHKNKQVAIQDKRKSKADSVKRSVLKERPPLQDSKVDQSLSIVSEKRISLSSKENRAINTATDRNSSSFDSVLRNCKLVLHEQVKTPSSNKLAIPKPILPLRPTPAKLQQLTLANKLQETIPSSTASTGKKGTQPASSQKTATKMPDFNSIHKKRFEKMDSLQEFQIKKTERARKLFGANTLIAHASTNPGSELKKTQIRQKKASPLKRELKTGILAPGFRSNRPMQKQRSCGKLATQKRQEAEIRDKNRTFIQGVRSNKRFELQMKFRNMKNT